MSMLLTVQRSPASLSCWPGIQHLLYLPSHSTWHRTGEDVPIYSTHRVPARPGKQATFSWREGNGLLPAL